MSFSICWRAGFVVLNSLSFCLSVKLLISPSYLDEIFAGYSNLGCRLFSFITLSISCYSLLAWKVSIERSAVVLWEFPCVLFVVFLLLLLIFVLCVWSLLIWLICVLVCFPLGFIVSGLCFYVWEFLKFSSNPIIESFLLLYFWFPGPLSCLYYV